MPHFPSIGPESVIAVMTAMKQWANHHVSKTTFKILLLALSENLRHDLPPLFQKLAMRLLDRAAGSDDTIKYTVPLSIPHLDSAGVDDLVTLKAISNVINPLQGIRVSYRLEASVTDEFKEDAVFVFKTKRGVAYKIQKALTTFQDAEEPKDTEPIVVVAVRFITKTQDFPLRSDTADYVSFCHSFEILRGTDLEVGKLDQKGHFKQFQQLTTVPSLKNLVNIKALPATESLHPYRAVVEHVFWALGRFALASPAYPPFSSTIPDFSAKPFTATDVDFFKLITTLIRLFYRKTHKRLAMDSSYKSPRAAKTDLDSPLRLKVNNRGDVQILDDLLGGSRGGTAWSTTHWCAYRGVLVAKVPQTNVHKLLFFRTILSIDQFMSAHNVPIQWK